MENYLGAVLIGIGIAMLSYALGIKKGVDKGINMGKSMANLEMLDSIAKKYAENNLESNEEQDA